MNPLSTNMDNSKNKKRLIYFDYFRAFAILFIILGHCYNSWHVEYIWESTLVNIISGNTALFVFISGFFFHHIYLPKYHYWTFVKNKTKVVFVPYLILSLLFLIWYFFIHGDIVMTKVLHEYISPQLNETWLIITNLITGRTLWAYWYIPFIMLVFLLSPVFVRFTHLSLATKIQLITILFIVSMLVQRPAWELNPIHSLIYYFPYYLLGILYSMERHLINQWLERKSIILLIASVAVAIAMHLLGQTDNVGKASIFAWNGIDYMIFQKLSLIAFMLAFTMYLQQYDLPLLKTIANMSFAFYFLHQWTLSFMRDLGMMDAEHGFGGVLIIFIFVMLCTYLLSIAIKQALNGKSRYVIGW
jgi:probable poly-beta-1,6-N-acetyl-D-glucosamine export protein